MKSEQGEIYSDFDLDLEKTASNIEEKRKGKYTVTVERTMKGKANSGGHEFLFKNFNGDIYIRKGK